MALTIALLLTVVAVAECALGYSHRMAVLGMLAALNMASAAQLLLLTHLRRWSKTVAFAAGMTAFVGIIVGSALALRKDSPVVPSPTSWGLAGAVLFTTCLWIVARAMVQAGDSTNSNKERPIEETIAGILWEQAVASGLTALSIGASGSFPLAQIWCARSLLIWVIALATESSVRLLFAFAQQQGLLSTLSTNYVLRQVLRGHALQPRQAIASQDSAGLWSSEPSARNWLPMVPAGVAFLGVMLWGSSGLVNVEPHELGVYERLGSFLDEPLQPGIHYTLPYPFGRTHRLPVKRVAIMPIGFAAADSELFASPLLWTKPHGREEYPLLVGSGAEAVIVNALVRYQIDARPAAMCRYLTCSESPTITLRALAHRALLAELRGVSLDEILISDRAGLHRRLEGRIRESAQRHELGISIVNVDVLSIHPPVEVSVAYADIINARIEAEKGVTGAEVFAKSELIRCSMMSDSFVADARVAAAKRLAQVNEENSRYLAMADQYTADLAVVRNRLINNTLAAVLQNRPLTLIDARLPNNVQVWLDSGDAQRRSIPAE